MAGRRGDEAEAVVALIERELALVVAGGVAASVGEDPDLEQVDRLGGRGVVLAVDDAGAGGDDAST